MKKVFPNIVKIGPAYVYTKKVPVDAECNQCHYRFNCPFKGQSDNCMQTADKASLKQLDRFVYYTVWVKDAKDGKAYRLFVAPIDPMNPASANEFLALFMYCTRDLSFGDEVSISHNGKILISTFCYNLKDLLVDSKIIKNLYISDLMYNRHI